MTIRRALPLAGACLLLGACTVIPVGPSVVALPGSAKSMEQFQVDVASCQRYADSVIATVAGGTAANADNQAASSAAAGAALGAVTGAIIGAASGNAGQGAAVGAGTGLIFGAAAGSPYPAMSSYELQRGYDRAYLQCMYARGHQVPMARRASSGPSQPVYARPAASVPPPPSASGNATAPSGTGYAPPPPPSASGSAAAPSRSGYPPPVNVPPSSYPPPNTPPPPDLR